MAAPRRARLYGLLALICLSTPLALGVETILRRLMMPPDFDAVRAWLCPTLTPWAWATVPVTGAAAGLGWWLFSALQRRALARRRPDQDEAQVHARAQLEALILATSAPQVPAVAATMLFMMGASLTPVLVTMGVAMLGVLSLGLRIRASTPPSTSPSPRSPGA
ncbi:MAG: hypothetical protein KDK70_08915 [Myxococcales bacterium]|nr:hypothetical protein [Myxococcales bacterium]